jgi:hypothetical protein
MYLYLLAALVGHGWAETQVDAAPSVARGIASKRPKQSRKQFGENGSL